jgi:hypothetical protein
MPSLAAALLLGNFRTSAGRSVPTGPGEPDVPWQVVSVVDQVELDPLRIMAARRDRLKG